MYILVPIVTALITGTGGGRDSGGHRAEYTTARPCPRRMKPMRPIEKFVAWGRNMIYFGLNHTG